MDFMHDTLADGRLVRVLTLIDSHTRECLALVAQSHFRGADVARILRDIGAQRGLPRWITVDNGTEFTSRALDAWRTGITSPWTSVGRVNPGTTA
jgi:putative transposase